MYNPSNHIPLSKSMGANAFPIDGKYMFFTNGANGVYSYRPFQSTAEAIAYFPLGSSFRGNPSGQPWAFEVLINDGGTLSVDGGSITGGINSVWWWRDGVLDANLVKKNGSYVSLVYDMEFSGSDVQDQSGNPYIGILLTGTQRPFSVTVNGDVIQGFSYQKTVNNNLYGLAKTDGSAWSSDDVIMVAIVGESSAFIAILIIQNNSASNVDYTSASASGTLLPTESINTPTEPGESVSIDLILGQTCIYTIYNSDGSLYFTHTLIGPGTENGITMTSDQNQEFIISNT